MRKAIFLMTTILIFTTSICYAKIIITEPLIHSMAKAYGFYLGQQYTFEKIAKQFPHLAGDVGLVKNMFEAKFSSSLTKIDDNLSKIGKQEWEKMKKNISLEFDKTLGKKQLTNEGALQFIDLVQSRAKGNIESSIFETLILFNANYEENPELEFLDGYKKKYNSNNSSKAKGINFSVEHPVTWASEEGNRPNIVQKFVSQHREGSAIFMILIINFPDLYSEQDFARELQDVYAAKKFNELIPADSTFLEGGKMTLETLKGYWVKFRTQANRGKFEFYTESIIYAIPYQNKLIQLQGTVTLGVDGKLFQNTSFKKYEKTFDLMVNSFMLEDVYMR